MAEETGGVRFHFVRQRAVGNPMFFDPQTDLRTLLPKVLEEALGRLEDADLGPQAREAIAYISDCVRIFEIKVLEDANSGVDSLVTEFLHAMQAVPPAIRLAWYSTVVDAMFCIHALFCRRDIATDGPALKTMLNYTRLAIMQELAPEFKERLKKELSAGASFLVDNEFKGDGVIECEETGERIENVKRIASLFMPRSGDQSWDALAKACDIEFERGTRDDKSQIVLALAYPTYEQRNLVVEADGPKAKDPEPEKAEQSGAVQVVGDETPAAERPDIAK